MVTIFFVKYIFICELFHKFASRLSSECIDLQQESFFILCEGTI